MLLIIFLLNYLSSMSLFTSQVLVRFYVKLQIVTVAADSMTQKVLSQLPSPQFFFNMYSTFCQRRIWVSGDPWVQDYVEAPTPTTKQPQEERSKIIY